ncbi:MAG TPA: FkbM family methyltransferase [Pirellulales bacterium]|nr:FkbM family methyltransferase [Pirellulales bacterium]
MKNWSAYRLARNIRHLPGLRRLDWLWDGLRPIFRRAINTDGSGVPIVIGGHCAARLPPEFCGGDWHLYEAEVIGALTTFLRREPQSLVLDIGCAIGIVSAAALFASPQCEVIAFDADLASLQATRRMTAYAPGDRLNVVHGFLAEEHHSEEDLDGAVRTTRQRLENSSVTGDPGTTSYRCLDETQPADIPVHSLDGLWRTRSEFWMPGRPVLIKCDVEGAELRVLMGAQQFLAERRPALLLSVHPPALLPYGHCCDDVRAFLADAGYEITVLAIDHEEHWSCVPRSDLAE